MKNFNQKFIYHFILFLIKQLLIQEFEIDPTILNDSLIIIEILKKKLFL